MNVIELSQVGSDMIDLVGGKAAGLGEMIKAGERVPPGFCLTTTAHRAGTIPEDELIHAYEQLGGGPVAVRSSATAEDLPDASFAGQQDTILNVTGSAALVEAVRKCWDSLYTDRAIAYRKTNQIDDASMAVVIQQMIDPAVAGVLFTANPITGRRTEMIVDAAPGLGTAIVDGTVVPDHYVLDGTPLPAEQEGCLDKDQLDELHQAGGRLQQHFGSPQDIEWAIGHDRTLWLLQSRPITTLFPLPPDNGLPGTRILLEFGNLQGMLRPCTPMGISVMRVGMAQWMEEYGGRVEDQFDALPRMVSVAGHLYMDITDFVRSKRLRKRLPEGMEVYGPRVKSAVLAIMDDPRFSARPGMPFRTGAIAKAMARFLPRGVAGIIGTLARPDAARARTFRDVEDIKRQSAAPESLSTAAERLQWVLTESWKPIMSREFEDLMWPLFTGIWLSGVPGMLLKGVATEEEMNATLAGMPHNVTTDMDLELWQVAQKAREHRELLLNTPPAELAERYLAGELPDMGLAGFLGKYGFRAAAEIDVGMPRWAEDPTPLFSTIANYLRVDDPEQAPDQRFQRAAVMAEAKIEEIARRARRKRPVRGRIAAFLMGRSRKLTGLREIAKFAWLPALGETRRQLLLIGADLAAKGVLESADDIMFLDMREVSGAVHDDADHRETVKGRRAEYDTELRRTTVPAALLSDGTDVETIAPAPPAEEGVLTGMAGAAGQATGRARVIRDPVGAHIEPGEILVAPTTDPGWTPLFMTIAGLVTETGAAVAHGPTVAREYGIPAVICVRDATTKIETGQLITINGATGTVHLEEDAVPAS